jgi:hypothetical protein
MTTASAMELPACRTLPITDDLFARAASDIALIGGGLLMLHDAPLMAVSLPSDGWQTDSPLMIWNAALDPCEDSVRAVCEAPLTGPALEALCLAADALHDRLIAWRWQGVDVRGLCAITDGTGLAIGRISDLMKGLLHAAPRVTPVLPMATDGLWALLAEVAGDAACH